MTYEGWSNYETWAVNLWISNDQGLYESAIQATRNALGLGDLRVWFEEFTVEIVDSESFTGLAGDLITHALGMVDYMEIAQAWWEDRDVDDPCGDCGHAKDRHDSDSGSCLIGSGARYCLCDAYQEVTK